MIYSDNSKSRLSREIDGLENALFKPTVLFLSAFCCVLAIFTYLKMFENVCAHCDSAISSAWIHKMWLSNILSQTTSTSLNPHGEPFVPSYMSTTVRETCLHMNFSCSFQKSPSPSEKSMLVNHAEIDNLLLENSSIISEVPFLVDVSTPDITDNDDTFLQDIELNPLAEPFIPILNDFSFDDTAEGLPSGNVSSIDDSDNPTNTLRQLKSKNTKRPVIAHININSISIPCF